MRNFLREPLVQFLLLGTILFAIFEFIGRFNLEKPRQILVTPQQIDTLNKSFKIDFDREPTPEDTERLIQDFIREEVFVQEAARQELHLHDQKVRQQLRQLMEESHSVIPVPTDEDLEQFLQQNPGRFRASPADPVPPLAQIKPTVRSVWQATRRKESIDAAFHSYLQNYIVVVQRPSAPSTAPTTAAEALQ